MISDYGDYKVIKKVKKGSSPKYLVECKVCGRQQVTGLATLRYRNNVHGNICSKLTIKEVGIKTHKWQFYRIWRNMRTRTTNPNYEKWDRYGKRGINSDEFEYFVDFYDAMYESYLEHVSQYGEEDTTLDRIDNNKSYSKSNCRWVTWNEQADNKSSNLFFIATSPDGQEYSGKNLKKFCEENNLSYQNAISGVHQGNLTWKSGWFFKIV